jgi:cytosine/adenosine deaminase-related metal-dependent hydrolase
VGSDTNTVIDLLEEARGVELHERLRSGRRGLISPQTLLTALTEDGHRSLGWPEAGRIAVGAPCDLVAVGTDSQRLASVGTSDLLAAVVSLGAADDVRHVVVGGTTVVANGRHQLVDDLSGELRTTVQRLLSD